MALPLPNIDQNLLRGGPVVSAQQGMNALASQIMKNQIMAQQVPYAAPEIQAKLAQEQAQTNRLQQLTPLMAEHEQQVNALYRPSMESQIAARNALTQKQQVMTPLQAKALAMKNQFLPEMTKQQLAMDQAKAQYYKMGGGRGGVLGKYVDRLHAQLQQDHPEWSNQQVGQAQSAYLAGASQFPDGTFLPPLSGTARTYKDAISKGRTTGALMTKAIQGRQADAELDVLTGYANEGLKPYGDTLGSLSPKQVVDSFKTDSASQKRLGRFVASQALQYEIAQVRNRMAGGAPGIASTEELLKMSGQRLHTIYPMLSFKAREEASRYMNEALRKGLRARQKVGYGGGSAFKEVKNKTLTYDLKTGTWKEE